jgi:dihydrofolate reductase
VRRLILKMSISLDGFVGGPNGEIDWIFRSLDEAATAWTLDTLSRAGLHVMGSRTYRDMLAYWPSSTEPFARPMNEIPKAVFTTSGAADGTTTRALEDATRNRAPELPADLTGWRDARLLTGDLVTEVDRIKREPGADILAHGGARFARSLVAHGLCDELRLLVHPVVLGRGLPLFSELAEPLDLTLVASTPFPSGAVALVYRPVRGASSSPR